MENSVVVSDAFSTEVVVGDMADSVIYSGVDLGPDLLFNTGDETWTAGHMNRVDVRGKISGASLIGVGVDPEADGLFFSADDVGVGGGIDELTIKDYDAAGGGVPGDAYGVIAAEYIAPFGAGKTPLTVSEGSPYVDGDFHVSVTGL